MEFQTSARLDIFCKIVNDTFCTSKAGRKRSYVPKTTSCSHICKRTDQKAQIPN